ISASRFFTSVESHTPTPSVLKFDVIVGFAIGISVRHSCSRSVPSAKPSHGGWVSTLASPQLPFPRPPNPPTPHLTARPRAAPRRRAARRTAGRPAGRTPPPNTERRGGGEGNPP